MRSTLALTVVALSAPSVANAAITAFYRTNTNNDVAGSYGTYSSLQNLGNHSTTGPDTAISPSLSSMRHTYIFGDFVQAQTTLRSSTAPS